jgi:hypothetical protein
VTWDFDILKGDVSFTVLRTKHTLSKEEHHIHHISGLPVSTQIIDKNMQVGRDMSIVEPPHICRDGDSVQVFIYMTRLIRLRILDVSIHLNLYNHQSSVLHLELLCCQGIKIK